MPENQPSTTAENPVVASFIDGLHTVERDGDPAALAGLVTAEAEVTSIDGHGPRTGPEGMSELFSQYVAQFESLDTTFTHVTETDTSATLEWTTEVELPDGHRTDYAGVTVLDLADGAITRFATIYDSGALLRPRADSHPVD